MPDVLGFSFSTRVDRRVLREKTDLNVRSLVPSPVHDRSSQGGVSTPLTPYRVPGSRPVTPPVVGGGHKGIVEHGPRGFAADSGGVVSIDVAVVEYLTVSPGHSQVSKTGGPAVGRTPPRGV